MTSRVEYGHTRTRTWLERLLALERRVSNVPDVE
jgi:hypothetical protein